MVKNAELDTLIQKIGKLNKKIRFVAIMNKNGKILPGCNCSQKDESGI